MKKAELRERERLLKRRQKLSEVERYRLAVLERKWELHIGKAVQAGKTVVYLALLLMLVGGCRCPCEKAIDKEQKRWGAPFVVPRPDGVREQWIPPQFSDPENEIISAIICEPSDVEAPPGSKHNELERRSLCLHFRISSDGHLVDGPYYRERKIAE